MSISSIRIDRATYESSGQGFSPLPLDDRLEMRGLGRLVVLAGPNGGGKTRLLGMLPKLLNLWRPPDSRAALAHDLQQLEISFKQSESFVTAFGQREPVDPSEQGRLTGHRDNVARTRLKLDERRQLLRAADSVELSSSTTPRVISFVPAVSKLVDVHDRSRWDIERRAEMLRATVQDCESNAPAYAERVFRSAMEHGYERLRQGIAVESEAEIQRDKLLMTLRNLLGASHELQWVEGRLKIGGYVEFAERLSQGQQLLFQFGCLLHAQEATLDNCIVVMDEPENHLHPAALLEVVTLLRQRLSESQLWIATHSVPLVAELVSSDPDCLWYVEQGKVSRAGRAPEIVLNGLLGGPAGAARLRELAMLPAQYAATRFFAECLIPPGVVGPDVKDPQTSQIREGLLAFAAARKKSGGLLRVLDIGAGKGRLLSTLRQTSVGVERWLDYLAFDVSEENRAECEREIEQTYADEAGYPRWFGDLHELEAHIGLGTVDVVVMCNVLHEVHPDEWVRELKKLGDLLAADGWLTVVEDYGMSVGEQAHRFGFLLLDEAELVKLFNVNADDRTAGRFVRRSATEPAYIGRLVAHDISAACVRRITDSSRRAAIRKLRERMLDIVAGMLKTESDNRRSGRDYARAAQLLSVAQVWLGMHDHDENPEQ